MDDQDASDRGTVDRGTGRAAPTGAAGQTPTDEAPTDEAPSGEPGPATLRTGAEQSWDPEDVAIAEGRDPTPENVERAQRELDEHGRAIIERIVP